MLVIFLLTDFGAILGAYGVYKYGALQEYMNRFEAMNKKYEEELESLKETKGELRGSVRGITKNVEG